jgi:hypothetical protein
MDPTELSQLYVLLDTLGNAPAKSSKLLEIAREWTDDGTYADVIDKVGDFVMQAKATSPASSPDAFRAALVRVAERSASMDGPERLAADAIRARLS